MLEIRELHRAYGDVLALDGVSFTVERGSMVGFVGRNGAGKTTTMRVVMGIVRPDRGEVVWDGHPIDEDVRLTFGYMPEERGLYPKMRVRDQLVYFARLSGLTREGAAASTEHWIEHLGVQDRADSVLEELSLGNQQRVQLAAALVHRPDLLVLDEPFSGLDPVGVDVLSTALREETERGAAIVFSSHQLELVERLCDDVVIIEAGRVVTDGTPDVAPGGGQRLTVEVAGADPRWAERLASVRVLQRDGERLLLELDERGDPDLVLAEARAVGSVRYFQIGARSLADRFREAVER